MDTDVRQKYQDRLDRVIKAIELQVPDRVPVMGAPGNWVMGEQRFSALELMFDPSKVDLITKKFLIEHDFDCVSVLVTRAGPAFQVLGHGRGGYSLPSDASMMQYVDTSYMEPEEYPDLIRDPYAFIFSTVLPRKYPALADPPPYSTYALAKSALLYSQFQSGLGEYIRQWVNNFGMLSLTRGTTRVPFDLIADYLRGFKGIMVDLRRYPEQILEACEALLPLMIKWALVTLGVTGHRLPLVFLPLHTPTFLGPRNFERFYWPTFMQLIGAITGAGSGCFIFFEGNWNPLLEYLQDLPGEPGQIVALFETVDMRRAKEMLGRKMCIAGNFSSELLSFGSPAEIEAEVRRLIDEAAPGGGYILTTNRGMTDATADRVRLLLELVHRYGQY